MPELGYEEEGDETSADEVEEEDIENIVLAQENEVKQVESDVEDDEQEFECSKLNGVLPVPEVREWNSLYGIKSDDGSHHQYVFLVVAVLQSICYRVYA